MYFLAVAMGVLEQGLVRRPLARAVRASRLLAALGRAAPVAAALRPAGRPIGFVRVASR